MRAVFLSLALLLPGSAAAITANEFFHALRNYLSGADPTEPATGLYFETFIPSGPLVVGGDDRSAIGTLGAVKVFDPNDWRGLLVHVKSGYVIDTRALPLTFDLQDLTTNPIGYPICERAIVNGWALDGTPAILPPGPAYKLSPNRLEIGTFMGLQQNATLDGCEFTAAPALPTWARGDVWRRIAAP